MTTFEWVLGHSSQKDGQSQPNERSYGGRNRLRQGDWINDRNRIIPEALAPNEACSVVALADIARKSAGPSLVMPIANVALYSTHDLREATRHHAPCIRPGARHALACSTRLALRSSTRRVRCPLSRQRARGKPGCDEGLSPGTGEGRSRQSRRRSSHCHVLGWRLTSGVARLWNPGSAARHHAQDRRTA